MGATLTRRPVLTVVFGPCGAGKTWNLERVQALCPGVRVHDEGFLVRYSVTRKVRRWLREGHDCVVSDITFCLAEKRAELMRWLERNHLNVTLRWVCFKSDMRTANANCRARARSSGKRARIHLKINARYEQLHSIPAEALVLPITPRPKARRQR